MQQFVKQKVGSGSPAANTESEQPEPHQSNYSLETKRKRRREADIARVPLPGNALTKPNIAALQTQHQVASKSSDAVHFQPNQQRNQSGPVRSPFGTENGLTDAPTVKSVVQVEDSQKIPHPQKKSQAHQTAVEHDDEDYDGEYSSEFDLHIVEESAANYLADSINTSLPVHVRDGGRLHHRGAFDNTAASYPPTTTGDLEDESHSDVSLQTVDAVVDRKVYEPVSQVDHLFRQNKHTNYEQARTLKPPWLPQNSKTLPISKTMLENDPIRDKLAVRDRDAAPVTQRSQSIAETVPPSIQRQAKDSVSQTPTLQPFALTAQKSTRVKHHQLMEGRTSSNDDDDLSSDDSGESDRHTLDYSLADLAKMPYDDLMREPQDHNPRPKCLELPEELRANTLSDRLRHIKGLTRDQQTLFFASLDFQKWEAAGDWFLEQFADTLQFLREARREKRKLIAEVEEKIHGRHEHVDVRKRKIDEALAEMKSSGASVLNGTPHKKRR